MRSLHRQLLLFAGIYYSFIFVLTVVAHEETQGGVEECGGLLPKGRTRCAACNLPSASSVQLWGFSVLTTFGLMFLYPSVIAPLFNKFEPLKDEELKTKIETLVRTNSLASETYTNGGGHSFIL